MKSFFLYFFLFVLLTSVSYNMVAQHASNNFLRGEMNRKNEIIDRQNEVIEKQREVINFYDAVIEKLKNYIEEMEKGSYYEKFKDRIT